MCHLYAGTARCGIARFWRLWLDHRYGDGAATHDGHQLIVTKALQEAQPEPLATFATTDFSVITRGRSITRHAFESAKGVQSCGWVPANISLTPFDEIADPNPWGSQGDLRLLPDPTARFTCWPKGAATPLDLIMS